MDFPDPVDPHVLISVDAHDLLGHQGVATCPWGGLAALLGAVRCRRRSDVGLFRLDDTGRFDWPAVTVGVCAALHRRERTLAQQCPSEQLVAPVRSAARGDELIEPAIVKRLVQQFIHSARLAPENSPAGMAALPPHKGEVLRQLAHALSIAEIAEKLVITEGTVKTHVARILAELGLRDHVQAVAFAYESGFVNPWARERASGMRPRCEGRATTGLRARKKWLLS